MGRYSGQASNPPWESVGGPPPISTADLPDGVPEDQLKDAKDHRIGHLQSVKRTMDS
jgi:protein-tyrosine phosphatase